MIISFAATLFLAVLGMVPGWLLMGRKTGKPGQMAGALAASLVVTMLVTALLGIGWQFATGMQASVLLYIPIALAGIAVAWRVTAKRAPSMQSAPMEWHGLALGAIFLAYGLGVQALAVRETAEGALLVHGWYNADWFKHLGHVNALSSFGLPARDMFHQAEPLYYYWLSYVLPGAGTAIGNDAWAALNATNSLFTLLFGCVFYGVIRLSGARPALSLGIGLLALFISAPISFVQEMIFGIGLEGILALDQAPKGPAMLTMSQYIPQHMLVLTLLLGWILLDRDDARAPRSLVMVALAALASAMTISVLLGAMVLGVYGFLQLMRHRFAALPETAILAVLSIALVLAFQVIQIGNPASAIESPLLTNEVVTAPWFIRGINAVVIILSNVGVPTLVTIFMLLRWKPTEQPEVLAKQIVAVLLLVTILATFVTEAALTSRLALETRIRATNLPAIANAIAGAWLVLTLWQRDRRTQLMTVAVVALLVALALPSAIIRTWWHGRIGDNFTTTVPRDDRLLLAYMARETDRQAIVFQYPEPPILAPERGDDSWSAILGGRAVTGSLRATDYPLAAPRIAIAEEFFAGGNVAIPEEASLVYLSRALHSASYDALLEKMRLAKNWREAACYTDACLFERVRKE